MTSNGMFAEIPHWRAILPRKHVQALMGGQALTAGELANAAGITAQTASGHLARMTIAGLVTIREARTPSLLPAGVTCRCAHDGKHHASRL